MKMTAHILFLALLAAFGTAAFANVSAAGNMKMQMLATADVHAAMVECGDCDVDGPSTMSCGEMCFTSHMIAFAATESDIPSMHRVAFLDVPDFPIGRQASPDPFPPKAIILN